MKLNKRKLQSMVRHILTEDVKSAAAKAFAGMDQALKDEKDTSKRLKKKSDATPAALKQIVDGAKKATEGKKDLEKMKAEMRYYTLRGVTYQMRNGKGTYTIKTLDGETTTLDASKVGAAPSEALSKVAKASKAVAKASKAGGGSSKKSSEEQTKNIQLIIGAKDDGKWGKQTSAKWSEWISSDVGLKGIATLAAEKGIALKENKKISRLELRNLLEVSAFFPHMNEQDDGEETANTGTSDSETGEIEISDELKKYVEANKGNAAKIAKALGYSGNLSGVNQLAKDVKSKAGNTGKSDSSGEEGKGEEEKKKGEPAKADNTWTKNRWANKKVAKKVVNNLNDKYPSIYDSWPMMGRTEAAVGKALGKQDGCPGLHVGFVRSKEELGKDFFDFIQRGGYSSLSDVEGYGDEPINIYTPGNAEVDAGDTATDLYYDDAAKELLLDTSTGDAVIKGIYLSNNKKYLYIDTARYSKEFDDEGNRLDESRKMFNILRKYKII